LVSVTVVAVTTVDGACLASVPSAGVGSVTVKAGTNGEGAGLSCVPSDGVGSVTVVACTTGEGAGVASVFLVFVGSVIVVADTRSEVSVLAFVRLADVGPLTVVAGTTSEGAGMAHVDCVTVVAGTQVSALKKKCKKRADSLFKLSRNQLRSVVAFLTGHAPVSKHLNIIGPFEGHPTCRFCGSVTETVHHIVCGCKALARQRYNLFGKMFAEPRDISKAPLKDLCLFISITGLMNQC
jgi:hypothetical protein